MQCKPRPYNEAFREKRWQADVARAGDDPVTDNAENKCAGGCRQQPLSHDHARADTKQTLFICSESVLHRKSMRQEPRLRRANYGVP